MKPRCANCEREFDSSINKDRWQEHERGRYCSEACKKDWGRSYDSYVDPLGFYQSKAGDPYE
jgi:hypothetical protein